MSEVTFFMTKMSIELIKKNLSYFNKDHIVTLLSDTVMSELNEIEDFNEYEFYYKGMKCYYFDEEKQRHLILRYKLDEGSRGPLDLSKWTLYTLDGSIIDNDASDEITSTLAMTRFIADRHYITDCPIGYNNYDPRIHSLLCVHSVRGLLEHDDYDILSIQAIQLKTFKMYKNESIIFYILKK